jgi:cyclophilin family peptidyl-prolyl cis-trans isomerase
MRAHLALSAALVLACGVAQAQPLPAPQAAPSGPVANIQTSLGTITIALDSAHAPATVANFIRYAREGHFGGTAVYRVVPGFVIQMGSYDAQGGFRPLHAPIALETSAGLKNVRGSVAMGRQAVPQSATAEFFIDLDDNSSLDPDAAAPPNTTGYAVFGHVTGGMDVVDKIAAVPLHGGKGPFPDAAPATPVTIEKVTIADTAAPASPTK